MLKARNKSREHNKLGITLFGLLGHEGALFESMIRSSPELAKIFELRKPDKAGACDIVVINQDSDLAMSWWNKTKTQNPAAIPMFLTNSRQGLDDGAYCKRPFSPSLLKAAIEDQISRNQTLLQSSLQ